MVTRSSFEAEQQRERDDRQRRFGLLTERAYLRQLAQASKRLKPLSREEWNRLRGKAGDDAG